MAENKKQIPLRVSNELYEQLVKWADSEFRSVNGQIEYILSECVKQHNKSGKTVPDFAKIEEEKVLNFLIK